MALMDRFEEESEASSPGSSSVAPPYTPPDSWKPSSGHQYPYWSILSYTLSLVANCYKGWKDIFTMAHNVLCIVSARAERHRSAWSHFYRVRLFWHNFFSNVTLYCDIVRKWDFHRSKNNFISFQSVQLQFSDDITMKSYVTKKLSQKVARDENGTKHPSGTLHTC